MSLKILLADDNITAQRLGSKILTDAGHAVIAVSNGAAAVKKIAADKPDLLILDVYMPGYSGLEVCEKVKNDPATSQVPVILTVTNMEPFNQADGNRVRSDGLMIKPFEATDLLAVVQKFAAKAKPKEPEYAHTMKMAAVEEFKDASYEEWKATEPEEEKKIDVPQEMAAAPALGFDDPAPQPVHMDEAAPVMEQPAPAPAAFEIPAAAPAFDAAPPSFGVEEHAPAFGLEQPAPSFDQHASFDLNAPAVDHTAPIDAHAELMTPVTEHHDPIDAHAALSHPTEFEATSAAPIEVQVSQAAELESTSVTTPEVPIAQDPALVTDADEMSQFATHVGEAHPEQNDITVGVALPGLTVEEAAPAEEPAPVAETHEDTYATTIKMQAYSEPEPQAPPVAEPSPVEDEMQRAFAAGSSGAAAAPALAPEAQPEAAAAAPAPIHDELVAQFAAELDQVHQEREAMGETEPAPTASEAAALEASMEIAKEIPASQLDEEKIAAAVSRALDRYKEGLRSELIQSIVRELKG